MHTVVSGDPRFWWCYREDQKQYDGHHTASSRHPLNFLIGNWFVARYVFHNASYFQFVLYLLVYEDKAFCRRNDLAAVHQDEAWKDKLPIHAVHLNLAKEYLFGPKVKKVNKNYFFNPFIKLRRNKLKNTNVIANNVDYRFIKKN